MPAMLRWAQVATCAFVLGCGGEDPRSSAVGTASDASAAAEDAAGGDRDGGATHGADARVPAQPSAARRGKKPRMPEAPNAPADDEDAGTTTEADFSLSEPLEVSLELAAADWDALRREGRSLPATVSGSADEAFRGYTDFDARLSLAAEAAVDVRVRKKGYIGSISMFRPSLVVDFADDRVVAGFERLTLNNNREDLTNAHQCMAYELYAMAGLRAPRCGLARVTLNGETKGYFTNVEPIKKPFLRRVFGEDEGNLYELQAPTDLSLAQAERVELKTNEARNDRSDLMRLLEALTLPDDQLIAALDRLIDLDEYLSYWALEALIGQWDGLSGHGTNAFLYHAAKDDRFHPIAWGADQAFSSLNALIGEGTVSVYASTLLGKRLYALPEWRTKYRERLRELLDKLWQPNALLERLQQIAQVTSAPASAVATTEKFIQSQRDVLERELAGDGPAPRTIAVPLECDPSVPARSSLQLTWNAMPREGNLGDVVLALSQPVPGGSIDMDVRVHERPISYVRGAILGAAGVSVDGTAVLATSGIDAATLQSVVIAILLPLENYRPGTIDFHGYETYGLVVASTAQGQEVLGYLGEGTIHLELAGPNTGDPVSGEWQAKLAVPARP